MMSVDLDGFRYLQDAFAPEEVPLKNIYIYKPRCWEES